MGNTPVSEVEVESLLRVIRHPKLLRDLAVSEAERWLQASRDQSLAVAQAARSDLLRAYSIRLQSASCSGRSVLGGDSLVSRLEESDLDEFAVVAATTDSYNVILVLDVALSRLVGAVAIGSESLSVDVASG